MEYKKQHTTKYDSNLECIPHYKKHPQMMPFIGTEYGENGPKILLIGESHYLQPTSTIHLNPILWYESTDKDLDKVVTGGVRREYWATHTRACLTKKARNWKKKSFTIFRNLEAALVESGYPVADNTLRYIAFMNAFQRPAVSRSSIKHTHLDREHSAFTVQSVIDTIMPDHVIFVSRKAHKAIGSQLSISSKSLPHPASAWWNRSSKDGTGKEQFIGLIKTLHRDL